MMSDDRLDLEFRFQSQDSVVLNPLLKSDHSLTSFSSSVFPDSSSTPGKKQERAAIFNFYTHVLWVQLLTLLVAFITSPSYFSCFVQVPCTRDLLAASVIIQASAVYLHGYFSPQTNGLRILCYSSVLLFGFLPAILVPLIAPAAITVMNSFPPYVGAIQTRNRIPKDDSRTIPVNIDAEFR